MVDTAARPAAPRVTTFDTLVDESIVETRDTRTLVLDAGAHRQPWRAGQYVSIDPHQFAGLQSFVNYLEHAKGRREPPRAYSMSSAPHEPHLAITIKEEVFERGVTKYPPLISGFLVHHVRAGDRLSVIGFAGPYVLPEDIETRTNHVLHLCAGSGSVPDLSIVKDSLSRHTRLRHTFVYSNKTWDDVIFRDLLTQLERESAGRLRVIHTLTREAGSLPGGADVRRGRVDAGLLRTVLDEDPDSLVYACGPAITVWERRACAAQGTTPPPRFIEAMMVLLAEVGVPRKRITVESYG
ncbi:MAG: oxidoreductase [Vicinamibacterales bacterium]